MAGCDRNAAVALMALGTMFMAGKFCGFLSNHIDIASNYAGTLIALTNTFATIPGFIVPLFVGQLTHGNVIESNISNSLPICVMQILLKNSNFDFYSANLGSMADYILYNFRGISIRVNCLHFIRIRRRAAVESNFIDRKRKNMSS